MFNLIRRISYGVIPRPDRPWEEDATSNAPAPRRKRRLSSTERDVRDESEEASRGKKARSGSQSPETDNQEDRETPLPQPEAETTEVKEVTQGVKEVVLDGEPSETPSNEVVAEASTSGEDSAVAPESVPLPEDGNVDDDLADAPSSPAGSEDEIEAPEEAKEGEAEGVESVSSESKAEHHAATPEDGEAAVQKKDTTGIEEPTSTDGAEEPQGKEQQSSASE